VIESAPSTCKSVENRTREPAFGLRASHTLRLQTDRCGRPVGWNVAATLKPSRLSERRVPRSGTADSGCDWDRSS